MNKQNKKLDEVIDDIDLAKPKEQKEKKPTTFKEKVKKKLFTPQ